MNETKRLDLSLFMIYIVTYFKNLLKWLENIKMNSKEYRYALLEELQTQLDRAKKYQEYCGDLQEAHAVGKDIRAIFKSFCWFLKLLLRRH